RIVELEAEVEQLRDTVGELVDQITIMRSHVSFSRTFTAGSTGVTTNIHGPAQDDPASAFGTSDRYREQRRRQRFDRNSVDQAMRFALEPSHPRFDLNK